MGRYIPAEKTENALYDINDERCEANKNRFLFPLDTIVEFKDLNGFVSKFPKYGNRPNMGILNQLATIIYIRT